MKVAVPAQGGLVDEHFGHCQEFLVFAVSPNGSLTSEATIPSADGCGCKSGVAVTLARAGVTHLVAGNMGDGAVRVLGAQGIQVARGASGDAREAVLAFAEGRASTPGSGARPRRPGRRVRQALVNLLF